MQSALPISISSLLGIKWPKLLRIRGEQACAMSQSLILLPLGLMPEEVVQWANTTLSLKRFADGKSLVLVSRTTDERNVGFLLTWWQRGSNQASGDWQDSYFRRAHLVPQIYFFVAIAAASLLVIVFQKAIQQLPILSVPLALAPNILDNILCKMCKFNSTPFLAFKERILRDYSVQRANLVR